MQLTGTVSHVFGQVTLDSSYQEEREQIRESAQSSTDHFKAGLMGLSSGVFGGMTSILTQPYKGAQEYGFGVNNSTYIIIKSFSVLLNYRISEFLHTLYIFFLF